MHSLVSTRYDAEERMIANRQSTQIRAMGSSSPAGATHRAWTVGDQVPGRFTGRAAQ
jgi:hypothetical protein